MIKREIGIFLIVGAVTVLVDFSCYRYITWLAVTSADVAKGFGFIVGTIFAYIANRYLTFAHKKSHDSSLLRFVILYIVSLAVNVLVNSLALKFSSGALLVLQFPFLLATGISATINFIGMKLIVFNSSSLNGTS